MARKIQPLAIKENDEIESTLVTGEVNTCLKINISPFS